MKGRLAFWWHDRTRAEQIVLLIASIAISMLLWHSVGRPFIHVLKREEVRRDAAGRMLADVRALAIELDQVRGRPTQNLGNPLPAAIRADAEAAGFSVARVVDEGEDDAILVLDGVPSQPFFAWVAAAEQRRGLVVTRLTARFNGDATLAVSASLHRRKI
ncbi:MAG: ral secretion pathway protein [Rhizorhabdus sp.]|nr:ral secretion pathway protein [Rhizorhabdus sp.]